MSTTFIIEDNVPIPESTGGSKGYSAAIKKLKPGQSVWLPVKASTARVLRYRLCMRGAITGIPGDNRPTKSACSNYVVKAEGTGARIWRK